MAVSVKQDRGAWDTPIAEAKVLLFAMKVALNCGFVEVIFERLFGGHHHLQKGVVFIFSFSSF